MKRSAILWAGLLATVLAVLAGGLPNAVAMAAEQPSGSGSAAASDAADGTHGGSEGDSDTGAASRTTDADGADDAPAGDPSAGKELYWPLPWSGHATLIYDEAIDQLRTKGASSRVWRSRANVEIRSQPRAEGGHALSWITGDVEIAFISGIDEDEQTLVRTLAEAVQGLPASVRVDAEGGFVAIENLSELGAHVRRIVGAMFDKSLKDALARIDDPDQRAAAEARAHDQQPGILSSLASDEILGQQLAGKITPLLFPAGGGLIPDTRYEWQEAGTNMLGGDPLPLSTAFELQRDGGANGMIRALHTRNLDAEAAEPILRASMRAHAIRAGVPEPSIEEITRSIAGIRAEYRAEYLIDPATGIVHRLEVTKTSGAQGVEEIENAVLVLREAIAVAQAGEQEK